MEFPPANNILKKCRSVSAAQQIGASRPQTLWPGWRLTFIRTICPKVVRCKQGCLAQAGVANNQTPAKASLLDIVCFAFLFRK